MRRVLVTGATGFIGRHTLPPLLSWADQVHAASTRSAHPGDSDVRWHLADLLDGAQTERLVREARATHLLHLAWYTEHGRFWSSSENLRWVEASLRLIRLFERHGGIRIAVAGTCAEYDGNVGLCVERSTPLAPRTLYGASKVTLSEFLEGFAGEAGVSSVWGRVFFPYGPFESPDRLVASVIRSLLSARPALCSHGEQVRDPLYVQDVGEALAALLMSEVTGPVNIASGRPIQLKGLISAIARKLEREDLVRLGALPAPEGDPPSLTASVKRLSQEVGWAPSFDLDRGLDLTITWWRERLDEAGGAKER